MKTPDPSKMHPDHRTCFMRFYGIATDTTDCHKAASMQIVHANRERVEPLPMQREDLQDWMITDCTLDVAYLAVRTNKLNRN